MTMSPLAKKVALVTGGAQGLGEALCRALGEDGAIVAVADIRRDAAEALATKLKHDGIDSVALPLDVADQGQAEAAIRRLQESHGGIDILINNAAIDKTVSIEELTVSEWHVEARPHGVKVTAVVSGGMRTPFLLDRFPDIDVGNLQDPRNVAETVRYILRLPADTVVPEITVIPMRETSWP
jgi:NAD(P)-dependent dehydrogenase (short-subunit alcohol dehydrogenase family)